MPEYLRKRFRAWRKTRVCNGPGVLIRARSIGPGRSNSTRWRTDRADCPLIHRPIRDKRDMPLDVLIVDDSAAIRKILHRVLVQAELPLGKVHEANDGYEALERMN